jgi:hypothetical protein
LCSWLRATGQAPDDQVGHSILIWKLDAAALRDALWGPPREYLFQPATELLNGI